MAPSRRSKPSVPSDAGDPSDCETQDNDAASAGSIPQAMQNIENLKETRAQNHAGIAEDYDAAIDMWKNQVASHFERQTREMETHYSQVLNQLLAAIDKKLACEEAIAAKIRSLDEDQAHLAMLLAAVYTGRQELARAALEATSGTTATTTTTMMKSTRGVTAKDGKLKSAVGAQMKNRK